MSSKVKSEKTKVKFAQSNINHVYKGNTTETHHKPSVRQYGMQVVGKLQGTRRLPPPAWVPSLKAEVGGLDSHVALVPPGGSGWGVPTSGVSTNEQLDVQSPEVDIFPTVSVSSVSEKNQDGLENLDKPRRLFTDSLSVDFTTPGLNGPSDASTAIQASGSANQQVTSVSKSQADKPSASAAGGLPANKPFFQRPSPVVAVTTVAVSTSTNQTESLNQTVKSCGGARDIVGEPSGWVAIDQEDPDFNEQILFSDEDAMSEDAKLPVKTSMAVSENKEMIRTVSSTPPTPAKITSNITENTKPFTSSMIDHTGLRRIPNYSPIPQNMYSENSNLAVPDSWSTMDLPYSLNCLAGQPLPRHPTPTIPFTMQPLAHPCVVSSDNNHLFQSPHLMRTVSSHGFNDNLFSHITQSRVVTAGSNNILDSIRPVIDVDTELQNAQRQARTQEFRTAVERAQQARVARQKPSESCSMDTDTLLLKSSTLLAASSVVSAPINTPVTPLPANLLLPPNSHSLNPFINSVSSQILLSSAFQKTANNRPDLAAAVAAATAAAIAYQTNSCPTANRTPADRAIPLQPHQSVSSTSGDLGIWSNTFAPGVANTNMLGNLFTQQQLPQLLRNALTLSASGPQLSKQAPPQQGVFLDPDYFVERFLEIFNQQQQASRPPNIIQSTFPSKNVFSSDTAVQACSDSPITSVNSVPKSAVSFVSTSSNHTNSTCTQSGSSDKNVLPCSTNQSTYNQLITNSVTPHEADTPNEHHKASRVPGLMDVKVSCSVSEHLSHLWDKEEANHRGHRGRSKHSFSVKSQRGGSRARGSYRHIGEICTDDSRPTSLLESGDSEYCNNDNGPSYRSTKVDLKSDTSWNGKTNLNINRNSDTFTNSVSKVGLIANSCWGPPDLYLTNPMQSSTDDSEAEEHGDLNDVPEDVESQEKLEEHYKSSKISTADNRIPKKGRSLLDSSNLPDKCLIKGYRNEYTNRARRGRRGQSMYFTSSRNYDAEDRYGKISDRDYYSRQPYGYSLGTKGSRSGQGDTVQDQRKSRTTDDIPYRSSERGYRTTRGFTGSNGYTTRTYNDRETYIRDPNATHNDFLRSITFSDNRRPLRSQKTFVSSKGQFSSTKDYYYDYNYSDGESSKPYRKSQDSEGTMISTRNKNFDSAGRFHKAYKKSAEASSKSVGMSSADQPTQTVSHTDDTKTSTKKPVVAGKDIVLDDLDDSDIPIVRVPAVDPTLQSARQLHSYPRNGRGLSKGEVNRRSNIRSTGQPHQQPKRSDDGAQALRRYHDTRDRFHDDEKDGGGGAAAGSSGTTRSISGAGGSSVTFKSGNSGNGNNSHSGGGGGGGNQYSGGGNNDSTVVCNRDAFCCDEEEVCDTQDLNVNCNNSRSFSNSSHRRNLIINPTGSFSRTKGRSYESSSTNEWSGTIESSSTNPGPFSSGAQFSRPSDVSTIPPLMSIKTQGVFSHHLLKSFKSWQPHCRRTNEFNLKENCDNHAADGDVYTDAVEAAAHADGFTKVISKASKNFAKRRIHQTSYSNKGAVDYKLNVEPPDSQSIENDHLTSTSASKPTTVTSIKNSPRKNKLLANKVTFMGPPLSLDSLTPITTIPNPSLCSQDSSTVLNNNSSSILKAMSVGAVRTWSKVVGTKAVKVSTSANLIDPDFPNRASVIVTSSSIWREGAPKHADSTACSSGQKIIGNEDDLLSSLICTSSNATHSQIMCTYPSVQSLWSTAHSTIDQGKNDTNCSSGVVPTAAAVSMTSSPSQIYNNICKVKPQQQQSVQSNSVPIIASSLSVCNASSSLSPENNLETNSYQHNCTTDLQDHERPIYEYGFNRSTEVLRHLYSEYAGNVTPSLTNATIPSSWSLGPMHPYYSGHQLSNINDNSVSNNSWPTIDPNLELNSGCITGNFSVSTNIQSHFIHPLTSDAPSNILSSNSTILPTDGKQSNHFFHSVQHPLSFSTESMGLYHHSNSVSEVGKLGSSAMGLSSPQVTFASAAASIYLHPSQPSVINPSQHTRTFFPSLPIPLHQPHLNHVQLPPPQKCRQRYDISSYVPYTSYPVDHQPTSVGLYSTIHDQSQQNYPQNPCRLNPGPPSSANAWSLLGNPTVSSTLHNSGQPYVPTAGPAAASGPGLLPPPIPQSGYGGSPCHFPTSPSISVFNNTPNYVGVIGGGRPNTDHSNASPRQRGIHNLYPHSNLPQSPSARGHQSFHLPSAFYPALSPSHQRLPLHQFAVSQPRGGIHGHMNPQNGLFTAFGPTSHQPNQPTPSPINHTINPLGFFNNPFHYPSRPDGLH